MDVTLLSLFEKNEAQFRKELSGIQLPENINLLQNFLSDFFVNKVSVAEYQKELSLTEIAMMNSVLKLVSLPMGLIGNIILPETDRTNTKQEIDDLVKHNKFESLLEKLDIRLVATTAIGGLVGGFCFRTWGAVLLAIAGCVLGMYYTPNDKKETAPSEPLQIKIDVEKYIKTLKQICGTIDEVLGKYRTSIANIKTQQDNKPHPTLASTYKPLLDRMASLYVAIDNDILPDAVKTEFNKLYRTLRNHHYEFVTYNENTREYYTEIPSTHITKPEIIKAAILENGKLLEQGECLIPETNL